MSNDSDFDDHLAKAKNSRDEADKTIKDIEKKIQKQENLIESNQQTHSSLENDKLDQEILSKTNKLKILEDLLTHKQGELDKILIEKASLTQEIELLQDTKDQLKKDTEQNSQILKSMKAEIENLNQEIILLKSNLKQKNIEYTTKMEKCSESEQKIKEIIVLIDQKKKDLEQLLQKEKDLQNSLKDLETQRIDMEKLLSQADQYKNQIKEYEEILEKLNTQIIEKQNQKINIQIILEKNESILKKQTADIIENETKLTELLEKEDKIDEIIEKQDILLDLNKSNLKQTTEELEKIKADYSYYKDRLNEIAAEFSTKQKQLQEITELKNQTEKAFISSRQSLDRLKKELEVQELEIMEKEKNIHRIDVLSFFYRISKFSAGIFLGIGILFIILGFGFVLSMIPKDALSTSFIEGLLFSAGTILIISSVFELEKL